MNRYNHSEMLFRIKNLKKESNITNEILSKKTGISLGTLSKILAGVTKEPSVESIIKISKALNVSADYLIFGSTEIDFENSSDILQKYSQLNNQGKTKADEYIDDLLINPKYIQKDKPSNKADIAADIMEEYKQDLARATIK